MTAQQAAAGSGFESSRYNPRKERRRRRKGRGACGPEGGVHYHEDEGAQEYHRGPGGFGDQGQHHYHHHYYHHGDGRGPDGKRHCRRGPIGSTISGIANKFGLPRKGVLIAWIITLIVNPPVGLTLLAVSWAFVHHPEWFSGLRNMFGGGRGAASAHRTTSSAGRTAGNTTDETPESRPTMGVDFEEPWMEELREKFDDLERRTGDMEGYVASGDYGLASEFERMRKEDAPKGGKSEDESPDPSANPDDDPARPKTD